MCCVSWASDFCVGDVANRVDPEPPSHFVLQAYRAFTDDQLRVIRRHVQDIVHAPIDTLERVGGGGVRCTLAELF